MKTERKEALMRIVVGIISGIIICVWKALISILGIVNFFIALFTAKRNMAIAEFSEIWNTQLYVFARYMTFVSNERPFPFKPLAKNMSKFEKSKK